jgi:hypothetical protein
VFVGLLVAGGMLLIRYAHQQDRLTSPASTPFTAPYALDIAVELCAGWSS